MPHCSWRSAEESGNNDYIVYNVNMCHTKYMMLPISGFKILRMCNISNIGNKVCLMFTK